MSDFDELLNRIRINPKNVGFQDLDKVLVDYGFVRKGTSSHYVYELRAHRIYVPYTRPFLEAIHVKQALLILDELDSPEATDES